jgi:hypothetical protein
MYLESKDCTCSSGLTYVRIVLQMEECLNDARQDPVKYKALYPCDYDKHIAPKLSAMKGGRRLPLKGRQTITVDLIDRLIFPSLDMCQGYKTALIVLISK